MTRDLLFWLQVAFVAGIMLLIACDARAVTPSAAPISATPAQTLQLNGSWAVVMCSDATFVHKAADNSLTVACPSDPAASRRTIIVKPCPTPKLTPVSGGYALSC